MDTAVAPVYVTDDGDNIAIGVPFSKINLKDRTVEGFATLDNVDKTFEVVDAEASREAFSSWIGNIREMHGPKAVGKAISIEERTLERNGKTYRGYWVKSRISKGAQDTWEKILDGTLQGYSIGGKVMERKPELVKGESGTYSTQRVNRITKYMLTELSVVDNPANPLAMFEGNSDPFLKNSLIKSTDGGLVAGDAIVENSGLFYCNDCDVAKMDDVSFTEIECLTCDNKMGKIADVAEAPTVTELKKYVDTAKAAYGACPNCGKSIASTATSCASCGWKKNTEYEFEILVDNDATGLGESIEWKANPEIETANPSLVQQANAPEGAPQSGSPAPHAEKVSVNDVREKGGMVTLDAQKAEGTKVKVTIQSGEVVLNPKLISEKVFEVLKSRVESTGRTRVDKENPLTEDQEFVKTILTDDGFPLNSKGEVRASIVLFNAPGRRVEKGYSMTDWAALGKSIAEAAGEGHSFMKGSVVGPLATEEDAKRGQFIVDLQKNTSSDNNDMIKLLHSLVGYMHEDSSINKGGETPTLDVKELEKIVEILDTASKEVADVIKGFSVEQLNSENASGPSLGSDPGEAGVGTAQENDGGESRTFAEVEVATATALPTPDNGPDKVVPDAIPVDGTGVHEGITADSGPAKVLPHADLASTSVTTKAEEGEEIKSEDATEDLLKGFMTKLEGAFEAINTRLEAVETSGGVKKSVEVTSDDELKKSTDGSFWGNMFSADELISNE